MGKELSEMSIEELWQLFPIFLEKPQRCWKEWYFEEATALKSLLRAARINHIGSTAVNSIWAKPIIDILIEVPLECDMETTERILTGNGYICMSREPHRISFNKGYTKNGFAEKVFHLHLRYAGDNDELYFRDYLIDNPNAAKDYEKLKLSLWKMYEHNRDGYTAAKTDFIKEHTAKAKRQYGKRY